MLDDLVEYIQNPMRNNNSCQTRAAKPTHEDQRQRVFD